MVQKRPVHLYNLWSYGADPRGARSALARDRCKGFFQFRGSLTPEIEKTHASWRRQARSAEATPLSLVSNKRPVCKDGFVKNELGQVWDCCLLPALVVFLQQVRYIRQHVASARWPTCLVCCNPSSENRRQSNG